MEHTRLSENGHVAVFAAIWCDCDDRGHAKILESPNETRKRNKVTIPSVAILKVDKDVNNNHTRSLAQSSV
eukprot:2706161-Amphidinium_carterae.1